MNMDNKDLINNFKMILDDRNQREDYFRSLPKPVSLTNKDFLDEIKDQYLNEQLVLVLGAGVSISCGAPNWNKLLQILHAKTFEENDILSSSYASIFEYIFRPNNLITARYISNYLKVENKFNLNVRESLYPKTITDSDLISELANLCTKKNHLKRLNSIITYNYDDILEENIRSKKDPLLFKSIYGESYLLNDNELPIFHVHGFLPRKGEISEENNIVLSEDTYHDQYRNINSWQNRIQTEKFSTKTCLFIGISLTDPNVRRLLDVSNSHLKNHYIIKPKYNYEEMKTKIRVFMDDKSSNPMYRFHALTDVSVTRTLIDEIEKFEEEDALSFNIKTLWVRDFDEIPKVLKKINAL